MPDDHEERCRRHEEIMEGLARLLAAQQEFNRQQQEFNHQQVEINADVKTTLARIEALIARMISTGEHGQEA